jgi:endonuclease-3
MAQGLVARHGGEVPADMDALTELRGVGRKTASVVLGHALGVPALPVDRHVLRVANRIGIASSDDPAVVETQLRAALPDSRWTRASDVLILHGRRICKPTPLCDQCAVRGDCDYFRALESAPPKGRGDRRPGAARRRSARRRAAKTGTRAARRPAAGKGPRRR